MIKVVCIGKVKEKHLSALIDDYRERIGHYTRFEVVEVKDEPITSNEQEVLSIEAERALSKIGNDEYVILIDLHGKSMDSLQFAEKIDRLQTHYPKITLVIGGSLGIGETLRKRANEGWKLSELTFLHQMTRLILFEQIYRAFKILAHETYHK